MSMIRIRALDEAHVHIVNDANDPFPIIGRIVPSYINGQWSYVEELDVVTKETSFPEDRIDWTQYIEHDNRIVFLAMDADECVGQIRLVKDWSRFAYIENIAIRQTYRKRGIGQMLIETAEQWAKEKRMISLSLEAQNDNLIACRFYERQGFQLGGVDSTKQYANPQIELTLYWYKIFKE